ncbi:MAG: hypothetical protein CSA72_09500 [Rhodobacterales bacterium]|nr:MAG: hypothetical protein CSA72_09500 [Rhodobacterales bacterium]
MEPLTDLQPGQRIARGISRHLARAHGMAVLEEVAPTRGLRVDVMALSPKGEIWVVECKSSRADFTSDHKWQGYLDWCDRFFWGVDPDFPTELLPDGTGLILADDYGGELLRTGPESRLAPARRKALTLLFARTAAQRAHAARDPKMAGIL